MGEVMKLGGLCPLFMYVSPCVWLMRAFPVDRFWVSRAILNTFGKVVHSILALELYMIGFVH